MAHLTHDVARSALLDARRGTVTHRATISLIIKTCNRLAFKQIIRVVCLLPTKKRAELDSIYILDFING